MLLYAKNVGVLVGEILKWREGGRKERRKEEKYNTP